MIASVPFYFMEGVERVIKRDVVNFAYRWIRTLLTCSTIPRYRFYFR